MEQKAKRTIIVSNRLPVTIERRMGRLHYHNSIGGLATALSSYHKKQRKIWVGWPGISSRAREKVGSKLLSKYRCLPVFLSREDVNRYYNGFCNETIWPLFHFLTPTTRYDARSWECYKKVNRLFADEIMRVARPDDIIWVHDYHLMLLPGFIRKELEDSSIGFFLHIPFPSVDIFRLMPWRKELLQGLLGADLIGFHTHEYVNNFLNSVLLLLGIDNELGRLMVNERTVKVDAFPLGVDFKKFFTASSQGSVRKEIRKFRQITGNRKFIFSIDRLDYTKGIPERLEAFDAFLAENPYWHERLSMVLVVSPSRGSGAQYQLLKKRIDELVGKINGRFGTVHWMPLVYINRTIPRKTLLALYNLADVALITPVRDGMNLVAKEYIASKSDGKGVLILSEMAGAAKELNEALIVNPNNKREIMEAIGRALDMPKEEQVARNRRMQERLRHYDVNRWASHFMEQMLEVKKLQKLLCARIADLSSLEAIGKAYRRARSRIIFLDYDGTLIPFSPRPEDAAPPGRLLDLLKRLSGARGNRVVIISGRDLETLDRWFGSLRLSLIAEHGAWIKMRQNGRWRMLMPLGTAWKEQVRQTLQLFVDRVPGSFIEEKDFSLAWHYRKADPATAVPQSRELLTILTQMAANLELSVLQGNSVVEIKNAGISKGRAAIAMLARKEYDFILAIGDDFTDEWMFRALPEGAYTIKVGVGSSHARLNFTGQDEVRPFLEGLLAGPRKDKEG